MFSKDLELSISQAYHAARSRRHEFLTVEHLLLALIDNPSARSVMQACSVDFERLSSELDQVLEQKGVTFDKQAFEQIRSHNS